MIVTIPNDKKILSELTNLPYPQPCQNHPSVRIRHPVPSLLLSHVRTLYLVYTLCLSNKEETPVFPYTHLQLKTGQHKEENR